MSYKYQGEVIFVMQSPRGMESVVQVGGGQASDWHKSEKGNLGEKIGWELNERRFAESGRCLESDITQK